ncbi:hypothetical protein [Erythrobacter mangrovi]|uniref:Uncharacterized protein n=1 Tax=Erythrobacter mangrovi TaxID=2739433 RepID=A0A7D3Y1N8_9SPHN|nr:hypothetical protein [Erythrobacter mangrovi]QKG72572.1 hypothetical protein HQR01_15030 [Erythrobacter mangrovi]
MTGFPSSSVFDRPLRPDLAAFFAMRAHGMKQGAQVAPQALTGILADLARSGRLR